MSKSSPIYISDDSDEDEKGDTDSRNHDIHLQFDYTEQRNKKPSTCSSALKVESESEETTPVKTSMNAFPKVKLTVNRKRLKWLTGVIKVSALSPVKTLRSHLPSSSSTSRVGKHVEVQDLMDLTSSNEDGTNKQLSNSTEEDLSSFPLSFKHFPEEYECPKMLRKSNSQKDGGSHRDLAFGSSQSLKETIQQPWSLSSEDDQEKHKFPITPKKSNLQKAVESPKKIGAFGSPQKPMKQTYISEESFSPKKIMVNSTKIEDTSVHTPPMHACQINGYVCAEKLEKPILTFTVSQINILEAIKEEGLVAKYIDAVVSFLSKYRKPPPQICFDLLCEVLLKTNNTFIVTKSLACLKRIQALHPSVPEQIEKELLNWELIEMIVKRMELTGCRCRKIEKSCDQPCLKMLGAYKALAFLINVMESEVPRKQFSLRRTISFRLLSLQRQSKKNVSQVVRWLKDCVATIHGSNESPSAYPCSNKNYLYQAVELFQRLIQLGLSVSENPESCAVELAGELLLAYNQLESLEGRTCFLQSFHSHLLRSKFLEKYLEIYCKHVEVFKNISDYSGVQRIIQVDFERFPQKREVNEKIFEAGNSHEWNRSQQECEEMSMVLSYSLQSYVFSHHKKLQCSPKTEVTIYKDDSPKQGNRKHLSISDVDQLCNMGDNVMILAGRLMSLCHEAALTRRTEQLVETLLTEMKLWDPW